MIDLRPYQSASIDAVHKYWQSGGKNPLIDLATGTGKSVVIAKIIKDLTDQYPIMRVLVLTHVKELVAQNHAEFAGFCPDIHAGIYSAGLNKRDTHHRVLFASIQSVFKRANVIGPRHLILIDEAHLVPSKGLGMYRQFLDASYDLEPNAQIVGLTATPYRLDSGRLDGGDERLFNKTVYEYGIGKGIKDGYLSPLISKAGLKEIDVSNVAKRGGEYVSGQLQTAAMKVTEQAIDEVVKYGQDRKGWLLFCSGVDHARQACDLIRQKGYSCEVVTGDTPMPERDAIIRRYKNSEIRCLCNVNVLTTGFNAPHVDLIGFLRSTLSTSLYVQIIGRGTRLANGKDDCLVLDFGGNVRRHGPVDLIEVRPKRSKANETGKIDEGDIRAKECPECKALVGLAAKVCKHCDYQFTADELAKHEAIADADSAIISTEKVPPKQLPVIKWSFRRHRKTGKNDSVRVGYIAGLQEVPEWVLIEHGGQMSDRAHAWWDAHGGQKPRPITTDDFLKRTHELTLPKTITVKKDGKYMRIIGRSFHNQIQRIAEVA